MDLISLAIKRPMAVVAAVLMIVVLGLVAIQAIPIQLTPDVRRPVLVIYTWWRGVAPAEVEREITNRVEQELTGIEGLELIASQSQLGRSRIVLEFKVNQNMDRAFMLVSNRLNGVSDLPDEASEPNIRTSTSDDVPIARFAVTRLDGNETAIETYGDFVDDVIVDRLERVAGISQITASGGSSREMQVVIDPAAMARYELTVPKILQALRGANASISAGAVDEGKRRYIVRTDSETASVDVVKKVVLSTYFDSTTQRLINVTVADVGEVDFGYEEPSSRRRFNGEPMIRLNAIREAGANVMETMRGLRAAVAELNTEVLPRERLKIEQFYDETIYIDSAIRLVKQNIYVGGTLAAIILLLFLRSARATLIVSIAIPVSVIGAFVAMALLGRSLNVISLAGIAFAVGMVVDAAIVVLENVYRHREMGKPAGVAALAGARQVWGAVLASVLTTVAVFVPLLVLELKAGQLFRDIAVAISVSVLLSLIVAVTVIPSLATRLFKNSRSIEESGRLHLPLIDPVAGAFARGALRLIDFIIHRRALALAVVLLVCGTTAVSTFSLLPKLDYLPDGNRNFVLGRIQPPPGFNLDTTYGVAERIEATLKPLWTRENPEPAKSDEPPKIADFFFLAFRNFTLIGASSDEITRAGELVPIVKQAIFKEPGMRGIVSQSSIFGRHIGGARVINLDISGEDLEEILDVARRADRLTRKALPRREGTQVRPRPGLEIAAPEVRVIPDLQRLAAANMTARDFGQTIDVFNDGMRVVEINVGSKRMDLTLKGPERAVDRTQGIDNLPIVTGEGTIVPASSLAAIEVTTGPPEIRHLERARTVTLQIRPAKKLPLEEAIDIIRKEVIGTIDAEGFPEGIKMRLSGAADDLTKTWNALKLNLLVAIIIVYLLMAVLFESLLYPLIIMFSVPLATAGGIGGLALLNTYVEQPLDMLTMLGFVILIGIVVNNAILLVDQTLQHLRQDHMAPADAIMEATRNRMRPIFMSTLTSVFGLLPLIVFPGAGSELYRGLGSVVIGGLTLSAVLTLAIIPPLLAVMVRRPSGQEAAPEPVKRAAE